MKCYVDPFGIKRASVPRTVKLKTGRTVSLPSSITDVQWLMLPGCTIEEVADRDTSEAFLVAETQRLAAAYPFVSAEKPGLVEDCKALLSIIVKAIQNGANLPTDRVPTFRELYNNASYSTADEAAKMLTLYHGVAMQCGGEERAYKLIGRLATYTG